MRRLILLSAALLCLSHAALGLAGEVGATTGGPVSPEGVAARIVLPLDLHMRNTGGSDGAGLCVFTSIEMAGRWQNVSTLDGLQAWMRKRPGGGHPSKVDTVLKAFCAEKGHPVPPYIQIESRDLDILRLAARTWRMPAITAAYLPGYRGRIAHMVDLAHAGQDGEPWAILDNNFPGRWAWLSEPEFLRSYTGGSGNGWSVVLLDPPPPPAPKEG
jgi:hypothetical protein